MLIYNIQEIRHALLSATELGTVKRDSPGVKPAAGHRLESFSIYFLLGGKGFDPTNCCSQQYLPSTSLMSHFSR